MKPALPDGYTQRPTTWDDLADVVALLRAADEATIGEPDITTEDVRSDWSAPRLVLERDAVVVHDAAGRLVGYGMAWERTAGAAVAVDSYSHPDLGDPTVDMVVWAWVLGRAQQIVDASGSPATVSTYRVAGEPSIAQVEADGFVEARRFARMVITLDAAPAVDPPDGITIAPFEVADAPAVHAALQEAFTDHWDFHPQPYEEWRARQLERDDFDPSLWSVAKDGDEVAGAVIGGVDAELDAGWIPTVGVRRRWRGRGLGGALLRASFAAFVRAGCPTVALGVDSAGTTGATRLYEREGMRVAFTTLCFQRPTPYTRELAPSPASPGSRSIEA